MAVIIDYRILLYSEDTKFLEGLKSAITDIMNLYHIKNYSICAFDNIYYVTNYVYVHKKKVHIFFLDIVQPKNIAISFASFLRNIGIQSSIVYIGDEYISDTNRCKIKIVDYLVKPINIEVIKNLLYYDYQCNFIGKYIYLNKNSNNYRIDINNIVCAEVSRRGIKIYFDKISELKRLSKSLELNKDIDFEEKSLFYAEKISSFKYRLDNRYFIQCHQSFLINIKKIISLQRYYAIVDNGTNEGMYIDISKNNWKLVRESYDKIHKISGLDHFLDHTDLEMVQAGNPSTLYPELFHEREL